MKMPSRKRSHDELVFGVLVLCIVLMMIAGLFVSGCAKPAKPPTFGGATPLGRAEARLQVIEKQSSEKPIRELAIEAWADVVNAGTDIKATLETRDRREQEIEAKANTFRTEAEVAKSSIGYRAERFLRGIFKWWVIGVVVFIGLRFAAVWMGGSIGSTIAWISTFALHVLFGFLSLPTWLADNLYFRKANKGRK